MHESITYLSWGSLIAVHWKWQKTHSVQAQIDLGKIDGIISDGHSLQMNYKPPSFNFLIPNVLKIAPVLALDKMHRDITSLKGICQKLTTIWVSQSHRAVQTKTGPFRPTGLYQPSWLTEPSPPSLFEGMSPYPSGDWLTIPTFSLIPEPRKAVSHHFVGDSLSKLWMIQWVLLIHLNPSDYWTIPPVIFSFLHARDNLGPTHCKSAINPYNQVCGLSIFDIGWAGILVAPFPSS